MRILDNIFDPFWVTTLARKLYYEPWKPLNVANSTTYPDGDIGSHRLMGTFWFQREEDSNDLITYGNNIELSHDLVRAFYAIQKRAQRNLKLTQIYGNLQFAGMDGTNHIDAPEHKQEISYVLMLSDGIHLENDGGEFINETTQEVVEFKNGRVIEINAEDLHRGRAFNTQYIPRFSVRFTGYEYRTNS